MSNRYQEVYRLPSKLYLEGSPVIIEAGALQKDNATGKVLAQIKLKNLSDNKIVACKVSIRAYEPSGNEIEGVEDFAFLDISVSKGNDFGAKTAIYLPQSNARRFTVYVTEVVYSDGSVWNSPQLPWKQVPAQMTIQDGLKSMELIKQYQIEVGKESSFYPEIIDGMFRCTCGTINLSKNCYRCGRNYFDLMNKLDVTSLKEKCNQRLKKEKEEREAAEKAAKKAKKRKKFVISLISILMCLCIIGYVAYRLNIYVKYNDAKKKTTNNTISAGQLITVGIDEDGSIIETGSFSGHKCSFYNWSNIVSVSAGKYNVVGLKADGNVVATGYNEWGQCNVSDWKNVISVAASNYHTVGLKYDGSVVAVGRNTDGQCDVSSWSDIISISAGENNTVGLKSDGTVVVAGSNSQSQCEVSEWTDIVAVASGSHHTVGLKSDGTVVAVGRNSNGECNVYDWSDIIAISAGASHTVGLKANGTVVAVGSSGYGEIKVSEWTDIVEIDSGDHYTVGLRSNGTVVAVGKNQSGQCNVYDWINIRVPD
jgi:hypothetical protein